MKRES